MTDESDATLLQAQWQLHAVFSVLRVMTFELTRTIRFQDTDAAGVVYFAQLLSICHEAYEASLQATGVELRNFFSQGAIAVPITHTTADFHRPLRCGDVVTITLVPTPTATDGFEVQYKVLNAAGQRAAIAMTRHICIDTATRQRHPLTPELKQWLQRWGTVAPSPTDTVPDD